MSLPWKAYTDNWQNRDYDCTEVYEYTQQLQYIHHRVTILFDKQRNNNFYKSTFKYLISYY